MTYDVTIRIVTKEFLIADTLEKLLAHVEFNHDRVIKFDIKQIEGVDNLSQQAYN